MRVRQFRYWLKNCPVLFYSEAEVLDIGRQAGFSKQKTVPIGGGAVFIGDV
jgi:hypothetical protein